MDKMAGEEFDRIVEVDVKKKLCEAFVSLRYDSRELDSTSRKRVFELKANRIKSELIDLIDSLNDLFCK